MANFEEFSTFNLCKSRFQGYKDTKEWTNKKILHNSPESRIKPLWLEIFMFSLCPKGTPSTQILFPSGQTILLSKGKIRVPFIISFFHSPFSHTAFEILFSVLYYFSWQINFLNLSNKNKHVRIFLWRIYFLFLRIIYARVGLLGLIAKWNSEVRTVRGWWLLVF